MTMLKEWTDDREQMLWIETVGLLHDLGKLSDVFLHSEAKADASDTVPEYAYKLLVDPARVYTILPGATDEATQEIAVWQNTAIDPNVGAPFKERADLTDVLEDAKFESWDGHTYSLAELLPATRPSHGRLRWDVGLGKPMLPATLVGHLHGIAHYEKETPGENKQPFKALYRSTAFGVESRVLTENKELTNALRALPLDRINEMFTGDRQDWLRDMQTLMERGLGDTRRPINEVTLWDWSYTVASLAKAALPTIIRRSAFLDDLAWRVLSVNVDLLGLYAQTHKITDLLGIRQEAERGLEAAKRLLEETYALANELYRDTTGCYFLFPNFDLDQTLAQQIINCFAPDLKVLVRLGEPIPAADLNPKAEKPETVRLLIAEPRHLAVENDNLSVCAAGVYDWQEMWRSNRSNEICTVCGLRPVGYWEESLDAPSWVKPEKAHKRHVCCVCLARRGRRSQHWATKEVRLRRTIWTDEVTDANGRAVLLVARFDLEGWLDGTLLATLPVTRKTTKGASPARIRRVWQTTQKFWQEVENRLTGDVIKTEAWLAPDGHRLVIIPANVRELREELGPFHTYELELEGRSLSIVWDPSGESGRFLTAENLIYAAKQYDQEPNWLRAQFQSDTTWTLWEPSGYQQPSKVKAVQLTVANCAFADETFIPCIPLLTEPDIFLALIPADQALQVAQRIKAEYEREMGRVRDRLPLHLGCVFFPRRTPIRAVLEAGQAMLSVAGRWHWEEWEIVQLDSSDGKRVVTFENDVQWHIPLLMGDGATEDQWYPHLLTHRPEQGIEPPRDHLQHAASGGLIARPVHDDGRPVIAPGPRPWKVWVRPSTFDFVFLDTTARRFEIHYDENGRRPARPTRPYLLDDLTRLERLWERFGQLAPAQINQVIGAIEETRQAWGVDLVKQREQDKVFWDFCADTLAGANWPKELRWREWTEAKREELVAAAAAGELADLVELHLQILKEKREE